jgi:hypothetical protein
VTIARRSKGAGSSRPVEDAGDEIQPDVIEGDVETVPISGRSGWITQTTE